MKKKFFLMLVALNIVMLVACGIPKNYDFSPARKKGTWICEEKQIIINWDNYEIGQGTILYYENIAVVQASFRVNTNIMTLSTDNLDGTDSIKKYSFKCTFFEDYFIAKSNDNYDLFDKDEELRFDLVEDDTQIDQIKPNDYVDR